MNENKINTSKIDNVIRNPTLPFQIQKTIVEKLIRYEEANNSSVYINPVFVNNNNNNNNNSYSTRVNKIDQPVNYLRYALLSKQWFKYIQSTINHLTTKFRLCKNTSSQFQKPLVRLMCWNDDMHRLSFDEPFSLLQSANIKSLTIYCHQLNRKELEAFRFEMNAFDILEELEYVKLDCVDAVVDSIPLIDKLTQINSKLVIDLHVRDSKNYYYITHSSVAAAAGQQPGDIVDFRNLVHKLTPKRLKTSIFILQDFLDQFREFIFLRLVDIIHILEPSKLVLELPMESYNAHYKYGLFTKFQSVKELEIRNDFVEFDSFAQLLTSNTITSLSLDVPLHFAYLALQEIDNPKSTAYNNSLKENLCIQMGSPPLQLNASNVRVDIETLFTNLRNNTSVVNLDLRCAPCVSHYYPEQNGEPPWESQEDDNDIYPMQASNWFNEQLSLALIENKVLQSLTVNFYEILSLEFYEKLGTTNRTIRKLVLNSHDIQPLIGFKQEEIITQLLDSFEKNDTLQEINIRSNDTIKEQLSTHKNVLSKHWYYEITNKLLDKHFNEIIVLLKLK